MNCTLRHFEWLSEADRGELFHQAPLPFDRFGPREELAQALGATLYMPATRPDIARDVVRLGGRGVTSIVLCLEDAIPDHALPQAEINLVDQLQQLTTEGAFHGAVLPLLFVRVRYLEQLTDITHRLEGAGAILSGFVLPKFAPGGGEQSLATVAALRAETGIDFKAMPVLETADMLHIEARPRALVRTHAILQEFRDLVLAVRVGATDLLSLFGLRRTRDLTAYDIPLLAGALGDIVNVLGRPGDDGFVVTGPVWEFFASRDRIFKPQLRQTPFESHDARPLRDDMVTKDLDGLIQEAVLDRANGMTGKTVIHPSHVLPVHALSVVTYEEFKDATDILDGLNAGGVQTSSFGNKMNEGRPHSAWASRTLTRARLFGVAAPDVGLVDFLVAGAARWADA